MMTVKRNVFFLIVFTLLCFVVVLSPANLSDIEHNNKNVEIQELKDFAFCMCLYKEFEEDSVFYDDGTASAIVELGSSSFENYELVNKFVEKYLDTLKIYSYENHRLGILKCLRLLHNESLDSVIRNLQVEDNFEEQDD